MSSRLASSARSLAISLVQQGIIAQNEFAKFLMIGSGGQIEIAAPLTDEERRDFEIHVRNHLGWALALQIKSVMELTRLSKNSLYIRSFFSVRASRVVNDPLFWYLYAFLDPKTMGFVDPVFFIPSEYFHQHANPEKKGGFWHFNFEASMEPGSHDQWAQFRVDTRQLGKKVLAVMQQQAKLRTVSPEASRLLNLPGITWLRKA
jgi:hypothetical protein